MKGIQTTRGREAEDLNRIVVKRHSLIGGGALLFLDVKPLLKRDGYDLRKLQRFFFASSTNSLRILVVMRMVTTSGRFSSASMRHLHDVRLLRVYTCASVPQGLQAMRSDAHRCPPMSSEAVPMPPLSKSKLLRLKRDLVSARILIQECSSTARREEEGDLAKRLGLISEHIALVLDYLEGLLSRP